MHAIDKYIYMKGWVILLYLSCNFGLQAQLHETLGDLAIPYKTQGGSNMTGTDLCVNKPHCAAAVRP